jgi:hypothetical protein
MEASVDLSLTVRKVQGRDGGGFVGSGLDVDHADMPVISCEVVVKRLRM